MPPCIQRFAWVVGALAERPQIVAAGRARRLQWHAKVLGEDLAQLKQITPRGVEITLLYM